MADETPDTPDAEQPPETATSANRPRTAAEKRHAILRANPEAKASGSAAPDSGVAADGETPDDAPKAATAETAPKATASKPDKPKGETAEKASAVLDNLQSGFKGATKREPYGLFAFAAFAGVLLWLFWYEDDEFGFWGLRLWTLFILPSVALVFAPMVRKALKIDEARAFQLCAGGAFGLCFAWIAFLLPDIASNKSFFGTIATACAGLAAWMAPGRPAPKGD